MSYFIHSEPGHDHTNGDAVAVRQHPHASDILLCALADGQGGQVGGAAAARLAVDKSVELAAGYPMKRLIKPAAWYEILSGADEAVSDDVDAGYTTLICLAVAGDFVCGASSGDSAVLLINDGRHQALTEKQHKNPPVGSSAAYPVAFSARLKTPWQLIVMSDGVWKDTGWDAIIAMAMARRGQELIDGLRELCLQQNGDKLWDDFSLAVIS